MRLITTVSLAPPTGIVHRFQTLKIAA